MHAWLSFLIKDTGHYWYLLKIIVSINKTLLGNVIKHLTSIKHCEKRLPLAASQWTKNCCGITEKPNAQLYSHNMALAGNRTRIGGSRGRYALATRSTLFSIVQGSNLRSKSTRNWWAQNIYWTKIIYTTPKLIREEKMPTKFNNWTIWIRKSTEKFDLICIMGKYSWLNH